MSTLRSKAHVAALSLAAVLPVSAGPTATCPGDTNADGSVDVGDLVNVVLDWGTDGSNNGGDVAGPTPNDPPDGIVDVQDMVAVILGWGDCAPSNDDCADAMDLAVPGTVAGSTTPASEDPEAFTCGDPPVAPGAPGVWYHVVGTGETFTASMCASPTPYDAVLHVYCGTTDDCGEGEQNNLLCAAGDDDGCGLIGDATVSEVSWCTGAGHHYLVHVAGFGASVGDFQLDVSAGEACGPLHACVVCFDCRPGPDDCEGPFRITDGLRDIDNTQATTDGPAHPGCEQADDEGATTEDLWYLYAAPVDGILMVTTCEQLGGSADFDTDLVFYGPFDAPVDLGVECEHASLTESLLACNDNDPLNECGTGGGGFHSTLFAPIESGRSYLLRVGGWFTGNTGAAELLVQSFAIGGDPCTSAVDLALGATTTVDTTGAGAVSDGFGCGAGPSVGPGRWYRIVGDGTTFTALLCNDAANPGLDTRLTVYCGGCDDLFCVGDEAPDNAPACGPNEMLSWCTFPGAEYLVLVHGAGPDDAGLIDLTVTSDGAPCAAPACLPPDACGGSVFQPRFLPEDDWIADVSDAFAGQFMHERFAWGGGSIASVRWWGFDARFGPGTVFECNEPSPAFEIVIHASTDGPFGPQPDLDAGPVHTEIATATLGRTDEYAGSIDFQAWQYTVNLAAPPALPAGDWWISIRDGDGDVCMLFWLGSRIGDGGALAEDTASGALSATNDQGMPFDDRSLCIEPAP